MNNWPTWLPYPRSWMSAIFLTLLTGSLTAGVRITGQLGYYLGRFAPRLGFLVAILAVLSPILLIAIAHHLLHLFLEHFSPNTSAPEMGKTQGFIPGLMSWWEGLYGWIVIVLATLVSIGVLGTFFFKPSVESLYYMLASWDKTNYLLTLPTIVWVIISAFIYHFEHLVRSHLMASGCSTGSNRR
ncbi:MAG: hypothetical protein AB1861_11975 [Cyanobacteriota bacterium]